MHTPPVFAATAASLLALAALALRVPQIAAQAPDASPAARHVTIPPERLEEIRRFVAQSHRRLGLPGVAISIATGDGVLLAEGFGQEAGRGTQIDGHTPFVIGSVTKTLTGAAIVRLAERERLGLDAPVEHTLPDFSLRSPFTPQSITARHLLGHRSGLRQWSGHDRLAQRDGAVAHIRPRGGPGERAEYSSLNYIILGRMLDAATATDFAQALPAILFQPTGMTDAIVNDGGPWPAGVGFGHQSYFGVQRRRREPVPPRYLIPAGFAALSAHDIGRFGGMLVGGGRIGDARVLSEASVREILGPLDSVGAALGWGRQRLRGAVAVEHAGNGRTSSARIRLVPERGYAIAVLANANSGPFFPANADILDGIHAIIEGEGAPSVYPKERLFKAALFAGTALSLFRAGRRASAWHDAGRPTRLDGSANTSVPLGLNVAGAAALLFVLPRYLGVPMHTMHEYFPDLGIAIVTSAVAGATGGLLHAWTRSAR